MNRHPGGEEHTRRLLELAALPEGARILDMGAGGGEAVRLMRAEGFRATGMDRARWIRFGMLAAVGPAALVLLLGLVGALRRRRHA